jgi:hypothetical protein
MQGGKNARFCAVSLVENDTPPNSGTLADMKNFCFSRTY